MENLIAKIFAKKPGRPKGGYHYVFQCLYCQKPFVAPGYEVKAGRMTKYCSVECANCSSQRIENLKKSLSKRSVSGENNPNYKDGRSFYKKYRKNFCEMCGKSENNGKKKRLLVHHLDKNRWNANPANLKTVCFSCHMKIHNPSNYGKYPQFQKW